MQISVNWSLVVIRFLDMYMQTPYELLTSKLVVFPPKARCPHLLTQLVHRDTVVMEYVISKYE